MTDAAAAAAQRSEGARATLRPRPEEIVVFAFAILIAVVVVLTGRIPPTFAPPLWRVARRLHAYFLGGVCVLGAISIARSYRAACAAPVAAARGEALCRAIAGAGALLRDFSPFYAVAVLYEVLRDLTPVLLPHVVDARLIAIDHAVFHVDVAAWVGRFATPTWSWIMAACYGAYYVLPIALAVALYGAGRRALFRDLMLAGVIASVLGFVGYLLVPAVGPYVFQADLFATRLPGGAYCPTFIRAIDDQRGVARDCFPSLHAAHATIVLVFAYRFRPRVFLLMLPIGLGLGVSTLYLRMHYAVDLAAGLAVAAAAIFIAPRLNRLVIS